MIDASWEGAARAAAQGGVEALDRFHLFHRHEKHMAAAEQAFETLDTLETTSRDRPLQAAIAVSRAMVGAAEHDDAAQETTARAALETIGRDSAILVAGGAAPLAGFVLQVSKAVDAAAEGEGSPSARIAESGLDALAQAEDSPWTQLVATLPMTMVEERLDLLGQSPGDSVPDLAAQARDLAARRIHPQARGVLARFLLERLAQEAEDLPSPAPQAAELVRNAARLCFSDESGGTAAILEGMQACANGHATPIQVGHRMMAMLQNAEDKAILGRLLLPDLPADGWGAWARALTSMPDLPSPTQAAILGQAVSSEAAGETLDASRARLASATLLTAMREGRVEARVAPAVLQELLGVVERSGPSQRTALDKCVESARILGLDDVARLAVALRVMGSPGATNASSLIESVLAETPGDLDTAALTRLADGLLEQALALSESQGDADTRANLRFLRTLGATPTKAESDRARSLMAGLEAVARHPGAGLQGLAEVAQSSLKPWNRAADRNSLIGVALEALGGRAEETGLESERLLAAASGSLSSLAELGEWGRARVGQVVLQMLAGPEEPLPARLARNGSALLDAAHQPAAQRAVGARLLEVLDGVARQDSASGYLGDLLVQARGQLDAAGDDATWLATLRRNLDEIVRLDALARMAGSPSDPVQGGRVERQDDQVVIGGVRVPVRSQPAQAAS